MAFTGLDVRRKYATGGSYFSQGFRSVGSRQLVTWDIKLIDDGLPPIVVPEEYTDLEILDIANAQYGLKFPRAGESLFEWRQDWTSNAAATALVGPWLRCSLVVPERNRADGLLWNTRSEFVTDSRFDVEEIDLELIRISTLTSIGSYPFLRETLWGDEERVVYEDAKTGNRQDLRLPTGSLYSEPFYRQFPSRTIRQTQFEIPDGSIEDLVEARLFTLNGTAVFGDPAPVDGDPNLVPRWKVTNIEYQRVNCPISTAGTIGYETEAYMISYTLERNSAPGGWLDRRALIDNYYLETANDLTSKQAYREPTDAATIIPALLNADGTLKQPQTGQPTYVDYTLQPVVSWSWLR